MLIKKNRAKNIELRLNNWRIRIFCFLFSFFFSVSADAQCAMCRAALGGEGNKVQAQAVNDGIVYLMVIPYLLVGAIGYYIYRMRMNKKQD
ncbi:hypothetical protein [Flavobacterium soyangense]|uniref:Uncharacterized protein n=1 Tax=Flavobacterium soyangense TaxID=2023265 RepID=A0A930XWN3_9FLAO|nr:hypothetical protein [Flavobacterium soyangense]MBF2709367.1 hypothetical protein [Flavobacterium soyangense]